MAKDKLIGDLTVLIDFPDVIQANLGIEEAIKLCEDSPQKIGKRILYELTKCLLTTKGKLNDDQREAFFEYYSKESGKTYEQLFIGETKIENLKEQRIFSNPFIMLQSSRKLFRGDIDEFTRIATFTGSLIDEEAVKFNKKYGGEIARGVDYQAKFDKDKGLYIGRWNSNIAPERIKTNGEFALKLL